jgi:HD-GYP domain-containing protein (c-di-GMP phosphodiesterase class II)
MGSSLGLPSYEFFELSLLAALHDIGRVVLAEKSLKETKSLIKKECVRIQKHPGIEYRLAQSSFEMDPAPEAILNHYGNWDGIGYTLGLKDGKIA